MYIRYKDNVEVHFYVMSTWGDEYCISESDWMIALINANTRSEVIDWFSNIMDEKIKKEIYAYKQYEFSTPDVYFETKDLSVEDAEYIRIYIAEEVKK